jgi:hypothetical protein
VASGAKGICHHLPLLFFSRPSLAEVMTPETVPELERFMHFDHFGVFAMTHIARGKGTRRQAERKEY